MKDKMKKIVNIMITVFLLGIMTSCGTNPGSKKKVDDWKYEIEAAGVGTEGTYLIKVWSYVNKNQSAQDLAKKNAVHGVIFKGFQDIEDIKGKDALVRESNGLTTHKEFFKEFFKDGGKYLKFVSLVNNGTIGAGDRLKISKKEYKIGLVISVDVKNLRYELEAAGIIRSLDSGF